MSATHKGISTTTISLKREIYERWSYLYPSLPDGWGRLVEWVQFRSCDDNRRLRKVFKEIRWDCISGEIGFVFYDPPYEPDISGLSAASRGEIDRNKYCLAALSRELEIGELWFPEGSSMLLGYDDLEDRDLGIQSLRPSYNAIDIYSLFEDEGEGEDEGEEEVDDGSSSEVSIGVMGASAAASGRSNGEVVVMDSKQQMMDKIKYRGKRVTTEAGLRVAVRQGSRAAKKIIGGSLPKEQKDKFIQLTSTTFGDAAFRALLALIVPQLPIEEALRERISDELFISGLTDLGNDIVEQIGTPLAEALVAPVGGGIKIAKSSEEA